LRPCKPFKRLSGDQASAKNSFNLTKVFIDTNVWFSAFYESINANKILKAHVDKKFKAVINQQVLDELVKNIKLKIPESAGPLQTFLEAAPPQIIRNPERISGTVRRLVNLKDQGILQSAINCRAEFFCTGNLKHFSAVKIRSRYNLQVLSPAQMVKLFKL